MLSMEKSVHGFSAIDLGGGPNLDLDALNAVNSVFRGRTALFVKKQFVFDTGSIRNP